MYGTAGMLRAVAFDLARLAVTGVSVPVIPQVVTTASGEVNAEVAANGTLVYVAGAVGPASRSLVWVDRSGREEPLPAPSRAYLYPRLSPDNTRIALHIPADEGDVWVWDLMRSALTRLTFDPALDRLPVWTHDNRSILFDSERGGESNIYIQTADGTGAPIRLSENRLAQIATSVTADGTQAVLHENVPDQGQDLRVLTLMPLRGGPLALATTPRESRPAQSVDSEGRSTVGEVRTLIGTRFDERGAMLSPDDRWLAYESDSSGRFEIYVRPFPNVGDGQWQVSTGGGVQPLWARDGRELFYLAGDGSLMKVPVQPVGQAWSAGPPAKLFAGGYYDGGRIRQSRHYDVTADGKRFLMIKDSGNAEVAPAPQTLTVVQNWHEELKRLVPTN
jgi:serine/threonine-protein kinase